MILTNATVANLPGGTATSFARSTLQIIDDDFQQGHLNFSSTNFVANEGTNAVVTVTRTGGTSGHLTVQVNVAAGVLTQGQISSLTWSNGDSAPKTVVVPISDDLVVRSNEVVNLTLSNPTVSGAIGQRGSATLTIIDNDSFGAFEFSRANYETEENGTNVLITVIRTNGAAGFASVQISVADGTATLNQDYTTNHIRSFLFNFIPGQTSTNFSIRILNDALTEGTETVRLSLLNPQQWNSNQPPVPESSGFVAMPF